MAHLDTSVFGAASTEGGWTLEIGRKRIGINTRLWGRQGRHSIQLWGQSTAADNRESGEHDNGGTLREPSPPLRGGW